MYKLILVDDEEEVREGILKRIDWDKYGFEIVGEAENGIEALDFAEKTLPDVVITDIKMPFMDGLALSERLKERFPTTRIIILTGFEEFEYAQRAVKLDVVEYVLKPVSSKELIEILVRVKNRLDEEMAQKRDIEVLKDYYKKSLPLLKEKFLSSIITNRMGQKEIAGKAEAYGVRLDGSGFVVCVMDIDFHISVKNKDKDGEPINEIIDFSTYKNKEIMNLAVLNTAEEIVGKHDSGIVFLNSDYIVVIFTLGSGDQSTFMEKILLILQEIHQYIKKYYKFTVTMGVGNFTQSITEVMDSYENAITALNYRILLSGSNIICIEDVEPESTRKVVFDELKQRALINSIKLGTIKEILETINELFNEFVDGKTSFKDYQIYLMEILTAILKIARDLNADMDKIFGTNYNLFVDMYNFKELREVKEWLIGISVKIRAYVSQERYDTTKQFVKKAREFVENNYNDYDITIDRVCGYLHISPTYFSTIFKRETKMTFVNYLTQIRMEAAKELLRGTNIKTLEIAKKVGYQEPNYFSYCFKKNFDISPSEYRKAFKVT